eukprot:2432225-Prymnesium_polylepis.1
MERDNAEWRDVREEMKRSRGHDDNAEWRKHCGALTQEQLASPALCRAHVELFGAAKVGNALERTLLHG